MRQGVLIVMALASVLSFGACVTEEAKRKAHGHFQEGVALLDQDRQQAFIAFQKSLELYADHKEANYYLGHIYAQQGRYREAEQCFSRVLQIDPHYSEAHTYLGQVQAKQERWPEAIASYRRALTNAMYSTPDLAWYHLGLALAHEGEMEQAIRALESATLTSPPNVPPAMLNLELGRAYYQMGYNQRAKETLTQVIKFDQGGEYAKAAVQLLSRLK